MPIEPEGGETQSEFMKRCVPDMMGDGKRDQDQAVAICLRIWRGEKEQKMYDPKASDPNLSDLVAQIKTASENIAAADEANNQRLEEVKTAVKASDTSMREIKAKCETLETSVNELYKRGGRPGAEAISDVDIAVRK